MILHQPCHTQAVERQVKLVRDAANWVVGYDRQDGVIQQRISSRKLMKSFNTLRLKFDAYTIHHMVHCYSCITVKSCLSPYVEAMQPIEQYANICDFLDFHAFLC